MEPDQYDAISVADIVAASGHVAIPGPDILGALKKLKGASGRVLIVAVFTSPAPRCVGTRSLSACDATLMREGSIVPSHQPGILNGLNRFYT